ncbi:MAG: hypothetical protein ABIJ34_04220 [archaeon]
MRKKIVFCVIFILILSSFVSARPPSSQETKETAPAPNPMDTINKLVDKGSDVFVDTVYDQVEKQTGEKIDDNMRGIAKDAVKVVVSPDQTKSQEYMDSMLDKASEGQWSNPGIASGKSKTPTGAATYSQKNTFSQPTLNMDGYCSKKEYWYDNEGSYLTSVDYQLYGNNFGTYILCSKKYFLGLLSGYDIYSLPNQIGKSSNLITSNAAASFALNDILKKYSSAGHDYNDIKRAWYIRNYFNYFILGTIIALLILLMTYRIVKVAHKNRELSKEMIEKARRAKKLNDENKHYDAFFLYSEIIDTLSDDENEFKTEIEKELNVTKAALLKKAKLDFKEADKLYREKKYQNAYSIYIKIKDDYEEIGITKDLKDLDEKIELCDGMLNIKNNKLADKLELRFINGEISEKTYLELKSKYKDTNAPIKALKTEPQRGGEYSSFAIIAIILAFFVPLLGLIFAIIALNDISKNPSKKGKNIASIALFVSVGIILFFIGMFAS